MINFAPGALSETGVTGGAISMSHQHSEGRGRLSTEFNSDLLG